MEGDEEDTIGSEARMALGDFEGVDVSDAGTAFLGVLCC